MDSLPPPADLLHSLTVGHSCRTVPVYLHQLVRHLQHGNTPGYHQQKAGIFSLSLTVAHVAPPSGQAHVQQL